MMDRHETGVGASRMGGPAGSILPLDAGSATDRRATPAELVYRIAAMTAALFLLVTVI